MEPEKKEPQELPKQPETFSNSRFWKVGFFILLALFVLALIVLAYLAGSGALFKQGAIEAPKPSPTHSQAPSPTISTSPTPSSSPKTEVPSGWKTFENKTHQYKISYPEGSIVSFSNDNCISITYQYGVVEIGVPGGDVCGRTGAAYELSYYSEETLANGKAYAVKVMVEKGPGEILRYHNETARFKLDNGFTVEYGSIPHDVATYSDYLSKTKPKLLTIVSTLTFQN